jgi:alkylation response protein AidB-like acyl-CoA dehydrogenase
MGRAVSHRDQIGRAHVLGTNAILSAARDVKQKYLRNLIGRWIAAFGLTEAMAALGQLQRAHARG